MCWRLCIDVVGMDKTVPAYKQQTEPVDLRWTPPPGVDTRTPVINEPLDLSTSHRLTSHSYTMDSYYQQHPQQTDRYSQWRGTYTYHEKEATPGVSWGCDRPRSHWAPYNTPQWDIYSHNRTLIKHDSDPSQFKYPDTDVYTERPSCVFAIPETQSPLSSEAGCDVSGDHGRNMAHTNGGYCKYSTREIGTPPAACTRTRTAKRTTYPSTAPYQYNGHDKPTIRTRISETSPGPPRTDDSGTVGMCVPTSTRHSETPGRHSGILVANSKHFTGGCMTNLLNDVKQHVLLPPISIPDFSFQVKLEPESYCIGGTLSSGIKEDLVTDNTQGKQDKTDTLISETDIKQECTDWRMPLNML